MAVSQGAVAQVTVAALPKADGPGNASPGRGIHNIVMTFGAGVRRIEVQGY
ncbi:MAG: hypothetical protein JO328_21315 [Hyphomicrobiales bacterium]|nr:hypothetical protein [Hyphomicrobiales bacterium]MBV9429106.1 hypothetical protein [Bradyrhizobiaceae bacterium]